MRQPTPSPSPRTRPRSRAERGTGPKFPFLFFGRRPGDWAEGANTGHGYEVRFQTPPDKQTRLAIAAAFEGALRDGPVRTSDADQPWLWAGHWALFNVGETRSPKGADAFFDAMEKAFRAIHEVAPLAEVVFMGVRERGTGDWDRWSLGQQEGPSRDPHFPDYLRHPDADYPDIQGAAPEERGLDGSVDRAFEKAREKARDTAPDATPAAGRTSGGSVKPKLVAIKAPAFPQSPEIPAKISSQFAPETPIVLDRVGSTGLLALGVKPKSMGQETISLFFDKPGAAPKAIKLPKGFYVAQAVSPDGSRAVVTHRQSGDVQEIALPDCTAKKVFNDPGTAQAAAYLDADRLAFLTDGALYVLAREGKAMSAVAKMPLPDMMGLAIVGTSQIVVAGLDEKVHVISFDGKALKETAKLASRAVVIVSDGGKVYLTNHRLPSRRTAFFVLEGLAG
ncbi:MAG: hypothetical protein IT379_37165 [Deltaproteobacteria bacterium]|nr:hypothetical protein [Deltaproteobacteria bacterium]